MATLTYWVCDIKDDHSTYNIRTKTKKEAVMKRAEFGEDSYREPRKVVIEYSDAFDLATWCLGEGRGGE